MRTALAQNETKIDTWTIQYISPAGNKYSGKLTITNKRLIYKVKFDLPANGKNEESVLAKWDNEGCLQIEKTDITDVQAEKNFMAKKAIVVLADGSSHSFNYGTLNIDKVVEAIRSS